MKIKNYKKQASICLAFLVLNLLIFSVESQAKYNFKFTLNAFLVVGKNHMIKNGSNKSLKNNSNNISNANKIIENGLANDDLNSDSSYSDNEENTGTLYVIKKHKSK